MRKLCAVLLAVALLGVLAPAAWAQAPAPKVTIVGLFDQVTSMSKNIGEGNYGHDSEREWYARTRFRPDFIFEVGRTKAVLGLEIDVCYGDVPTHGACQSGGDINTDLAGIMEVKWMYTEFDLTGKDSLMPFIPVGTVARAGLQPFASLGNYKIAYANGDFAGLSMVTTFAPNLKTNLTYVQVEENVLGGNRSVGSPNNSARLNTKTSEGDDFALIFSTDWTPMKGLDLKPMYSYFYAGGTTTGTSGNASRRGAVDRNLANFASGGNNTLNTAASVSGAGVANAAGQPNFNETRHTIGMDARWRWGAFSLDPTLLYQWGQYETLAKNTRPGNVVACNNNALAAVAANANGINCLKKVHGDASAWLLDIIAGYRLGPLNLELRYNFSTGNSARDNLSQAKRYFEPLDLDTSYYAGWANILALGVDYFNGGGGINGGMPSNIGYDRYGRNQFGVRATYSLTPALSFYTVVSPTWTHKSVDTDTGVAGAARTVVSDRSFVKGDSNYIGTEWDLGMTWRFAPNATFDLVGAILFAGEALDSTDCVDGTTATAPNAACNVAAGNSPNFLRKEGAKNGYTAAARVRFAF